MKHPKTLIIFDIDGTLLYSNKIDSQCFAQVYQDIYQRPFPSIDWSTYSDVTDTVIFEEVIQDHFDRLPTAKEIEHFKDEFVKSLLQKRAVNPADFQPVPNSQTTVLNLLKDPRFVIGIGTGGWRKPAMTKLAHVGIPTQELHASFADGKYTRVDIVQESIDSATAMHSDIERIVYVGDAPWDVHTTRKMNLPLIGIRWKGDHDLLQNLGCQTVLQDYSDYDLFLEAVAQASTPALV